MQTITLFIVTIFITLIFNLLWFAMRIKRTKPSGIILVITDDDENGQYLYLELYEDVDAIKVKDRVVFNVSQK